MVGLHGCSAWRPAWRPPQRRVPRHRDQGLVQERTHVVHLHIQGHPAQRHALEHLLLLGRTREPRSWKNISDVESFIWLGYIRVLCFVRVCARCRLSGAFQALFRTLAACMQPLPAARVEHALQFRAVTGPRQNKHCRTRIILPYRDRSTTKQTQVRVPTRPRPRAAQERPTHDLRRSGQRTTGRTASPARCASGGMVLSRVS